MFSVSGPPPRFWPASRSRPSEHPARASPRLARPSPAPRAPACSRHPALRSPRPSPAPFPCWPLVHAPTAAETFRRVATMCRRRPPRGSHGLSPRPRACLHLPQPVRSLTPSHAAFFLLQSREPQALHSPRPQLRRRRALAPPRHSPIPRARNSALPSFKPRSSLRRLPSTGRASPRLATDGHGAAVLGRHGSRLPSLLPPSLATLPHSPSPRTSRALACSPCRGRSWPPASWPSRAAAPSRAPARHPASAGQAEPGRGLTPCWAVFLPSRSGRAGRLWPWANCSPRAGPVFLK